MVLHHLQGAGEGCWLDLNLAEIEVGPGEAHTVYYVIKKGLNMQLAQAGASF